MNHWNRWFFDALEKKDVASVQQAVVVFFAIVAAMAAIGVCIVLTRETLQVRWRQWLVEHLLARWLDRQRFYHMNADGTEPPNPEYRISDDTRWATEILVDLGIGLLSALIGGIAFISILWTVGGSWTVGGVTIPAFMVVFALAYGITMSLVMAWVGKPLVGRVGAKNEAEGTFRFAMMRLRDNAESVALMGGSPAERTALGRFYDGVVARWLAVVRSHGHVTWITNSTGPMIPIIPLLVAAPKYLAGELTLGQVTQLAAAFVQVQIAISWVVDNYNRIAEWYASARRVMDIVYACDGVDTKLAARAADGAAPVAPGAALTLSRLTLAAADGRPLVTGADLALAPGERALVSGESSVGKSMLVRAIAGLWPSAGGAIARPPTDRSVMIVPQKSYLPLGTLADVLAYPSTAPLTPADARKALETVGLAALTPRLDETARWDQVLSAGERQRLAIARILVQKPDVAVLDDALGALEDETRRDLLARLGQALPRLTVLSLARKSERDNFHTRHLSLERAEGGARLERVS
jgi:putative ATP-binding cassette transporter